MKQRGQVIYSLVLGHKLLNNIVSFMSTCHRLQTSWHETILSSYLRPLTRLKNVYMKQYCQVICDLTQGYK